MQEMTEVSKRNISLDEDDQIDAEGQPLNSDNDLGEDNSKDPFEIRKKKVEKFLKWLRIKVEALLWCLACAITIYYTNFFRLIFEHPRINTLFLNIGMIGIGINSILGLYAGFYLPFIKKNRDPIDQVNPRAVQLGAIAGVTTFITIIIAIWPLWGWLSILIIFVFFMAIINVNHFLPANDLGSVMFGAIFFGAFFTDRFIEHGGMWHYDEGHAHTQSF
eukprot:TRINITY_DN3406_c0_g1_i3.p1 TRINITY_DN3406_c0_g1~~TRINITY_DN3406_c0_g1_i3.p1  ORF type:complete len:219 (+),score=25.09 TRINITY_DN3406_c0_g1_i3:50-706(+)